MPLQFGRGAAFLGNLVEVSPYRKGFCPELGYDKSKIERYSCHLFLQAWTRKQVFGT
jgi:hypothetical protein